MSDNKRIKLDMSNSLLGNGNGDEWIKNWRKGLKRICYHQGEDSVHHMFEITVITGEMKGVLKRGDEVVEVMCHRIGDKNKMELIIVNLKTRSLRLLRGDDEGELEEMDLSELKENGIIDLNDEGRRWEGKVLQGEMFGYGCLYDEENRLEYEGWMIEGVKRCYGIEYWNDLRVKKYSGCYYNGMKHGYGLLYDRKGEIIYDGLFYFNNTPNERTEFDVDDDSCYWYHSHVEFLKLDIHFNPNISSLFFPSLLMSLKRLEIGNGCFQKVKRFVMDGLIKLENVKIGKKSLKLNRKQAKGSKCIIMDCDELKELEIGEDSFCWYEELELKNLSSLMSVQMGDSTFRNCNSAIFDSENNE